MSKIGIYADPHFSINSSIVLGKTNGLSNRLNNLIESFRWMNQLFADQGVDLTICLGDLTDRPILSAEEITALSQCGLEDHHFILGNHCRSDKDGKINALSIFKNVYTEPTVIAVAGTRVLLLPYNSDLFDLNTEKVDIILSHNDIKNYNFGNFLSQTGFEIADILKSCQLFVNGHLHNGGWVVKDRIMNLGQLTGMNFSSCGGAWEPSVGIIDTEKMSVELFENPVAYRFKKVTCPKLKNLKDFLDTLPDGQYVVQAKTSVDLADSCRKLLDQSRKVIASRIITTDPNVQRRMTEQQNIKQVENNGTVYDKFKQFLSEQPSLKFDISKLNNILDQLSSIDKGAEK